MQGVSNLPRGLMPENLSSEAKFRNQVDRAGRGWLMFNRDAEWILSIVVWWWWNKHMLLTLVADVDADLELE